MAKNNNGKAETFEKTLFKAADKLRKNIDAAEYKHIVLGLIFLKYISDSFEALHTKLVEGKGEYKGADPEDADVAAHPEAIGYVSAGYLSKEVKALVVEGVRPTPETVSAGTYHLTRPLFLIASREPTGAARSFVDFALGSEGQGIVGQHYGQVR